MVRTTVSGSTPARRAKASWAAALGSGAMGSTSWTSVATASATAAAATRMTCVRQQGGFSGGASAGAAVSGCDVAGLRRRGLGGMPSAVVSCCDVAERCARTNKLGRHALTGLNKPSPDFNNRRKSEKLTPAAPVGSRRAGYGHRTYGGPTSIYTDAGPRPRGQIRVRGRAADAERPRPRAPYERSRRFPRLRSSTPRALARLVMPSRDPASSAQPPRVKKSMLQSDP